MEREALKLALEALEAASRIMDATAQQRQDDAIIAIKEALAQPAQEPVAWQFMNGSYFRKRRPKDFSDLTSDGFPYWNPLYTTPPQRPWVGLTDQEAQLIYDMGRTPSNLIDMVEAMLKDKNT